MMNISQHRLIRLFLLIQKRTQRGASIKSARRLTKWGEKFFSIPKGIQREPFTQDELPLEWLIPGDANPDDMILFFHGGFVFPLVNPTRYLAGHLAKITGMRILLVDFRLAPENPFPAALEDCLRAYRWLLTEHGVSPRHVIFVGESAGGNLALATLLSLRDSSDPLPNRSVLISPVLDLEGGETFFTQNDPMADAGFVMLQLNAYRGNADPRNPLLSPVHADLQGLPPLLVQAGGEELLRDHAQKIALKAKQAGVSVRLEIWPGMWHYWHIFLKSIPESRQALQQIADFIQADLDQDPGRT